MVDGDRLLILAQKRIISMAKRCTKDVYPLYYEMKKAKAEQLNGHSIYNGLKLAFTGGRIGGISNNITKIWSSPEINDEAKSAIKWLCMETNFTIDYAKTLFKPTRPKEVNDIISKYTRMKTPFFFQYAKDKDWDEDPEDSQVEPINDCTINKIVKTIKDNSCMYRKLTKLKAVDYKMLLPKGAGGYYNEELNECFQKWNRKYGTNVSFDEDTDHNNLPVVSAQIKEDLRRIVLDDECILESLVTYLYKYPSSKKKKLLWYMYGKEMYENVVANLPEEHNCWGCGKRTNETLIRHRCFQCRQAEMKQKGYKLIKCVDCGTELKLEPKSRACRCDACKAQERTEHNKKMYAARKIQPSS